MFKTLPLTHLFELVSRHLRFRDKPNHLFRVFDFEIIHLQDKAGTSRGTTKRKTKSRKKSISGSVVKDGFEKKISVAEPSSDVHTKSREMTGSKLDNRKKIVSDCYARPSIKSKQVKTKKMRTETEIMLSDAACENLYYIAHNAPHALQIRGFSSPNQPKTKKKGKKRYRFSLM
ncbi:small lysine-rich protein 1 [Plakobranchus ocellatus]|uniref:Small lysine-rich protein 1 n=1 Tax=Plakobranchus ocellatus TaxID=259542 RepID=A0AAV3ZEA8_9GAST|nr:small lysine-rich protein 1 [Plakobranchus ocellatus]